VPSGLALIGPSISSRACRELPSGFVELGDEPGVRQKRPQPLLRSEAPHGYDQILLQLSGELRFHSGHVNRASLALGR
jgi:hypothetical protein